MSEERLKVLDMLANGRISVEQAQQLFDVMGVDDGPSADREEHAASQPASHHNPSPPQDDDSQQERMFGSFTFSQAIAMGMHGITPQDIARIRAAGLHDLSFDQMLKMIMMGVDPEYIVNAQRMGTGLTFDQIVHLGMMGIDPSKVQQIRESGLEDLSFDEIVQIATLGIDPAFLTNLRAAEQV